MDEQLLAFRKTPDSSHILYWFVSTPELMNGQKTLLRSHRTLTGMLIHSLTTFMEYGG